MNALATYAVAGAVLVGGAGLALSAVLPADAGRGVWLAAAIAWLVQLAAFGVLLLARRGANFVVLWSSGVALRFVAVVATAFWVTEATSLPPAPALLSLVGFTFVLALLEPIFLRRAV